MRRTLLRMLASLLALTIIAAAVVVWSGYRFFTEIQTPPEPGPIRPLPRAAVTRTPQGLTILLVGIDARGSEASRADAIVVVHVDPAARTAAVVSLPRDSRVPIPGRGLDKINHAHAFGGPRLLAQTVEQFLGIRVDHYVRINFRGFRRVIDILGGIEVTVDRPMDEVFVNVLAKPVKRVHLDAGRQWLSGEEATLFVHFRGDQDGDIGRARRHQQVLAAVWRRLLEPGQLPKIPTILRELGDSIRTDLSPGDVLGLLQVARAIPEASVTWTVVGGHSRTINGISYWIPDPETVRRAGLALRGEP